MSDGQQRIKPGDLTVANRISDFYGRYSHDGLTGDEWEAFSAVRVQYVGGTQEGKEDVLRRPLPHVGRHSPTGFAWGYPGSGPADLALSILAAATGNKRLAFVLHQDFKRAHVVHWSQERGWGISKEDVLEWVQRALTDEVLERYAAIQTLPLKSIF